MLISPAGIVDEHGIPYLIDLYLDIAVYPDSSVVLLDEDDLSAALESHDITQEIYDNAYYTRRQVLENSLVDVGFLSSLGSRIREQFA